MKKQKDTANQKNIILRQPVAEMDFLSKEYIEFLDVLKQRIRIARTKASFSANREMINLYLEIGKEILHRQDSKKWGQAIVEKLSADLRSEFAGMKGLSPRNLWDMRRFAEEYYDDQNMRQLVAEIPWGHNLLLLNSVKDISEREWCIKKTIEHGWSRAVLNIKIGTGVFKREGRLTHNFKKTLPEPDSDLSAQVLKDPYIFDFLTMKEIADEKDIEEQLTQHITQFLLELGSGFAFVGRQYRVTVGDKDFYIDLLFYHLKLRRYIVVELKASEFKPEHVGKLNFYLSAIDSSLRNAKDNQTIGLILCKSRNKIVAEYALKGMNQPIGVAEYQLVRSIPEDLKAQLPSIEDIEIELDLIKAERKIMKNNLINSKIKKRKRKKG